MKDILVLSGQDIGKIIKMKDVLTAVEAAFKDYAEQKAKMPSKLYLELPEYNGNFRAMPAFVAGYAGLKWVNVHPLNKEKGIPTVMATIILNDPKTGEPIAYLDGTIITNYRTGAAGGIAAKYLARKNSKILGLVGAGVQSRTQLLAISEIFDLEKVKVFDLNKGAVDKFVNETLKIKPGMNIERVSSIREAVDSDIVCTVTPVRKPIVKAEWIKQGTHLNTIGADAQGKEELEPDIMKKENIKIVVDDIEQASHSGEVNVPLAKGIITKEDIYSTLPEVVAGKKPGREGNEITVFDSTGLAIQDVSTAKMIYEEALKKGVGIRIKNN